LAFLEQRRAALDLREILVRLPVADLAQYALRKRELRMRAGSDAEIIAEAPVVEVVPALAHRERERRGMVEGVAHRAGGRFERALDRVADFGRRVVVRQRRRITVKERIRLDREVIEGKMRRTVAERDPYVRASVVRRLPGKRVHQVEVDVIEDRERSGGRGMRLALVVHAPQSLEVACLEALHPEREPIHARLPVPPQL